MKFADSIELAGAYGTISYIHPAFARKLILSGRGKPVRKGKTVVGVQLPSAPCGPEDGRYHGGNSNRQHRVDVCDGGATVVIETERALPRTVVTQSCRVMSLKPSNRAFGEVMRAERAELSQETHASS